MLNRRKNQKPLPTGQPSLAPDNKRSDATHSAPKLTIVAGVEAVRELVAAAPQAIKTIYVRRDLQTRFANLIEVVKKQGGSIELSDEQTLNRLTNAQIKHQGIVASCHPFNYISLDEILEFQFDPILVIDGVTDPRNLGAIMRSAEGAGVRAIALARDRTAEITPVAIKASAGAWAHLKIAIIGNVARTLSYLKEHGYWVVGLAPEGSSTIYELDTDRKLAIVVGSEGKGMRPLVERTCDYLVSVPMYGNVGSLNVAVATGIALFELARRRALSVRGKNQ